MMGVHYLESLVRLLVTIVEFEPSVCKTSHIPAFLGAYSATRTRTGRSGPQYVSFFCCRDLYHTMTTLYCIVFFCLQTGDCCI